MNANIKKRRLVGQALPVFSINIAGISAGSTQPAKE